MDNNQMSENNLEHLLDALPLETVPSQLLSNIMSQIEPRYVPEPFRIRRSDILIAAGTTLLFFATLTLIFYWDSVIGLGWVSAELTQFAWLTPTTMLPLAIVSIELLLAYALYEAFGDTLL